MVSQYQINATRAKSLGQSRKFFDVLRATLEQVPARNEEKAFYEKLNRLLVAYEQNPKIRSVMVEEAIATESQVVAPMFDFQNVGVELPGNWTTIYNGAAFGNDYVTRTAVARSNIYVNRSNETSYMYLDLDAQGERLHGKKLIASSLLRVNCLQQKLSGH